MRGSSVGGCEETGKASSSCVPRMEFPVAIVRCMADRTRADAAVSGSILHRWKLRANYPSALPMTRVVEADRTPLSATSVTIIQRPRSTRIARSFVVFLLLIAMQVRADSVFNVTTTDDLIDDNIGDGICHTSANNCSLRAAVTQANALSGAGTAVIEVPAEVYELSLGNGLYLGNGANPNRSTIVSGAGATSTIIDADQLGNIAIDSRHTVILKNLTIRNGHANFGGGIDNSGMLTLIGCVIEDNQATDEGGGIGSIGVLNVLKSTIRSNHAYYGGGMSLNGISRVSESTVHDNSVLGSGGGIFSHGSFDSSKHLYVINSTISNNTADYDGGGIFGDFASSTTFLYNTTIVGNDADHDGDKFGGIGGGILAQPGARIVVVNSLVAGNTNALSSDNDCAGSVELYGLNLFSEGVAGCTLAGNGSSSFGTVGVDTIGPLQANGGPTLTNALLAGSQAIDTTTLQGCIDETGTALTTDQRGAPRVAGARCDVGAYEFDSVVPPTDVIFRSGFD